MKAEHKPSGVIAVGASISIFIPKGIVVTGSNTYRNTVENALWNIMLNSEHGRTLIIHVLTLLKEKERSVLIFEHEESRVDMGFSGFHYYMQFNSIMTTLTKENGRGDISIERTIETALVHELEHVKQRCEYKRSEPNYLDLPCTDNDKNGNDIDYSEVLAVKSENIARVQMDKVIRTHYANVNVFRKTLDTKKYLARKKQDINYNVYVLIIDKTQPISENEFIKKYQKQKKWKDVELDAWKEKCNIKETRLNGRFKGYTVDRTPKRGSEDKEWLISLK